MRRAMISLPSSGTMTGIGLSAGRVLRAMMAMIWSGLSAPALQAWPAALTSMISHAGSGAERLANATAVSTSARGSGSLRKATSADWPAWISVRSCCGRMLRWDYAIPIRGGYKLERGGVP